MSTRPNNCLVPIDASNWRAALAVRVSEEQEPMVADTQPVALVILAKAYVGDGGRRWEPLAYVDADGVIVAVLGLSYEDDVAEVRNFAVDLDRQREGLGTQVMHAVLDWCRAQGARAVELTHHPNNDAAAALYAKVGFSATGEVRHHEAVLRIAL